MVSQDKESRIPALGFPGPAYSLRGWRIRVPAGMVLKS